MSSDPLALRGFSRSASSADCSGQQSQRGQAHSGLKYRDRWKGSQGRAGRAEPDRHL